MGAPRLWDTTAVGGRWRWRGWGWRRTAQESWEWGGTQEILTEGLHAPWVGSAKVPADVPCHSATRKFNRRQEKTTETEEHHREALDGASVAVRRVDPNQIRLPRSQRMPTISALDPARHPTLFQHHNNTHAVILLWARSGVVSSQLATASDAPIPAALADPPLVVKFRAAIEPLLLQPRRPPGPPLPLPPTPPASTGAAPGVGGT